MRSQLATAAAAVVLISGCTAKQPSTTPTDPTATPTTASTATSTPTPEVSSPTPTPSPSEPATVGLPLGTWFDAGDGVRVRVITWRESVAETVKSEAAGGRWSAVLAQTCNDGSDPDVTVSWAPWSMYDARDGRYPASSATYRAFPRPEYPFFDTALRPGRCARGWIVFDTRKNATITEAEYSPAEDVYTTWTLPPEKARATR